MSPLLSPRDRRALSDLMDTSTSTQSCEGGLRKSTFLPATAFAREDARGEEASLADLDFSFLESESELHADHHNDADVSVLAEDLDFRCLESKLELLRVQRQISAARCEAFLAELESCQAGTPSSRRRLSLDSWPGSSTGSSNGRRRGKRVSRSQSSNARSYLNSPVPRSEGHASDFRRCTPEGPSRLCSRSPWGMK